MPRRTAPAPSRRLSLDQTKEVTGHDGLHQNYGWEKEGHGITQIEASSPLQDHIQGGGQPLGWIDTVHLRRAARDDRLLEHVHIQHRSSSTPSTEQAIEEEHCLQFRLQIPIIC